ncbi:hypothetical protein THAOC_29504, partial [Thalassiosira oceanica]
LKKPPRRGGHPAETRPLSSAAADVHVHIALLTAGGGKKEATPPNPVTCSYLAPLVASRRAGPAGCGFWAAWRRAGVAAAKFGGQNNDPKIPVNTSCLHQRQPTTKSRSGHVDCPGLTQRQIVPIRTFPGPDDPDLQGPDLTGTFADPDISQALPHRSGPIRAHTFRRLRVLIINIAPPSPPHRSQS